MHEQFELDISAKIPKFFPKTYYDIYLLSLLWNLPATFRSQISESLDF